MNDIVFIVRELKDEIEWIINNEMEFFPFSKIGDFIPEPYFIISCELDDLLHLTGAFLDLDR